MPRPKRALPKEGWLIADLAKLGSVTVRSVHYYLEKGLLAKPSFRGTATRYGRTALLRLLAIPRMQREDHLPLAAIRRRLEHMSSEELERYATEKVSSGAVAAALGIAAPRSAVSVIDAAEVPPTYAFLRWDHVLLVPGLALIVRSDASPMVKRLAQQIYDHCAAATKPT